VVLLTGERETLEDGTEVAKLFIPTEHTSAFVGKEAALYLEESEGGDTLIVEVTELDDSVIEGEATDVEDE
jgi:hypothetical protein